MNDYTLALAARRADGFVKATQIIARLDRTVPLQNAHARAVENLMRDGCRYANEDFDVLAAAYRAIGQTEIKPWEAKWIEAMNKVE